MDERWRDVPGLDGRYQVSNHGGVRRPVGIGFRMMRVYADRNGYRTFHPCLEGKKSYTVRLHRAMWEAFIGPIPPDHQLLHRDGDKDHNHLLRKLNRKTGAPERDRCNPTANNTNSKVPNVALSTQGTSC